MPDPEQGSEPVLALGLEPELELEAVLVPVLGCLLELVLEPELELEPEFGLGLECLGLTGWQKLRFDRHLTSDWTDLLWYDLQYYG